MKIIIVPGMPKIAGRRYHLARTLAGQSHEVHYLIWDLPYRISISQMLVHFKTSLFAKEYTYENFTIHKIRRLPYFWPLVNGWLFSYQLRKLSNKIGVDFIFSQSYTNEAEVPKGLRLVKDINDDNVAMAEDYGSAIYKLAFRLLGVRSAMRRQCQRALAVTSVSNATYEIGRRYNDNVYKLPNGVDAEVIRLVMDDKTTYPKNKYSIVYVTGFNQWSRPIETIEAVMQLKKDFPSIDLTLIGEGTEVKKIRKFIESKGVGDYIHYLGGIYDRKKLFGIINQSTVGLSISEKNKFRDAAQPLKVLEYSALGKKVVSTDLEEVKALDFPNTYIFSETKKDGFVNALRMALLDANNYTEVSDLVLEKYNWDRIAADLVRVVKKSQGGHGKGQYRNNVNQR